MCIRDRQRIGKCVNKIQGSSGRDRFVFVRTELQIIGVSGKGIQPGGPRAEIVDVSVHISSHVSAEYYVAVQQHAEDINRRGQIIQISIPGSGKQRFSVFEAGEKGLKITVCQVGKIGRCQITVQTVSYTHLPGSEIYGGLANTWDYGNLGVELKNNVKRAWWQKFVQENPYNVGVDLSLIHILDFHSRYYHPSNSYIFLYGDCDMAEKLSWLDENYLSKYDYLPIDSEVRTQAPFEHMAEVTRDYSCILYTSRCV